MLALWKEWHSDVLWSSKENNLFAPRSGLSVWMRQICQQTISCETRRLRPCRDSQHVLGRSLIKTHNPSPLVHISCGRGYITANYRRRTLARKSSLLVSAGCCCLPFFNINLWQHAVSVKRSPFRRTSLNFSFRTNTPVAVTPEAVFPPLCSFSR